MKKKVRKYDCFVQARLTQEQMERVKTLMNIAGYRSISNYLRDLLQQKRLPYRSNVSRVTDRELRDQINRLIFQVNKIGVNYNQVAATYQKQAQRFRPDGTPYLNTSLSDQTMTELMRYTSELRDEFAVILHFIKKYLTANGYDGKI